MLALSSCSANATKIYNKEEATALCATGINQMLTVLDEMAREGKSAEELKAGVATKDPEMVSLIQKFIDEVMSKKPVEAGKTLDQVFSTCVRKMQQVEV